MIDMIRNAFGGQLPAGSVSSQLEQLAAAEDIKRAQQMREALDRYKGNWPDTLMVRPDQTAQANDNVVINYARLIVNTGVSFLFGSDIDFEIEVGTTTAAEHWLQDVWARNNKKTLLQDLAMNGAICGHAFIRIVHDPAARNPIRLLVLDPSTVSVRWEPDDIGTVVRYTVQYPALNPRTGKAFVRRQIIEDMGGRWSIVDQESQGDAGSFTTVNESIWPWDFAPIAGCQNLPSPNEYWGESDLPMDILKLNNTINFLMSNMSRIVRYHAHPKTWGQGFDAKQLRVAVDETVVLPTDASLQNLEMHGDLAGSISLYNRTKEALHEISAVPEVASGKIENIGQLSGVALQVLYQPLTNKTETKRGKYGDLLVELNRRLLAIGGFGEDVRVILQWPDVLPTDMLTERQALLIDDQLGVASKATIGAKLGYDYETERQTMDEEEEAAMARMGDAFARGQGPGLGVLNAPDGQDEA